MNKLGHVLGIEHGEGNSLMEDSLDTETRLLPYSVATPEYQTVEVSELSGDSYSIFDYEEDGTDEDDSGMVFDEETGEFYKQGKYHALVADRAEVRNGSKYSNGSAKKGSDWVVSI
jgi:hypothetical protein